ncbi:MAG TPA: single-stranded DNA-binding protein [Cellulomonas sp.]
MAVNDLDLTVIGWVGSDPRHYPGQEGHVAFTQFRLGSTRRVLDREQGVYVDGQTDWFTIKVFRAAATNVSESVRRGDPVVVHGRLQIDDWLNPEGLTRTTPVIVAAAVGHDLSRGTTRFVRTVRSSPPEGTEPSHGSDGLGMPETGGRGADGAGTEPGGPGPGAEERDPEGRPPVDVTGAAVLDDDAAVRLAR